MPNHFSARGGAGDGRDELVRRVRAADELVRRTVLLLCKDCPPGSSGRAARDARGGMGPGVRAALGALEDIEGKRPLNDEELARRRAFAMLL